MLLLLAGCGTLPQPFLGRPGATATRLAQPPPSRLSVPVPSQSLLPNAAAAAWAAAMADALTAEDIPAVTGSRPREWSLGMTAEMRGQT